MVYTRDTEYAATVDAGRLTDMLEETWEEAGYRVIHINLNERRIGGSGKTITEGSGRLESASSPSGDEGGVKDFEFEVNAGTNDDNVLYNPLEVIVSWD